MRRNADIIRGRGRGQRKQRKIKIERREAIPDHQDDMYTHAQLNLLSTPNTRATFYNHSNHSNHINQFNFISTSSTSYQLVQNTIS